MYFVLLFSIHSARCSIAFQFRQQIASQFPFPFQSIQLFISLPLLPSPRLSPLPLRLRSFAATLCTVLLSLSSVMCNNVHVCICKSTQTFSIHSQWQLFAIYVVPKAPKAPCTCSMHTTKIHIHFITIDDCCVLYIPPFIAVTCLCALSISMLWCALLFTVCYEAYYFIIALGLPMQFSACKFSILLALFYDVVFFLRRVCKCVCICMWVGGRTGISHGIRFYYSVFAYYFYVQVNSSNDCDFSKVKGM